MVFVGKRNVYAIPLELATRGNLATLSVSLQTSTPSTSSVTACAYALPFSPGQYDPYLVAKDSTCPPTTIDSPEQVRDTRGTRPHHASST